MATSRFIDWLRNLTAKSTTIDGTEQVHIDSSGLSQKATLKDVVSYAAQNLAQTWNSGSTVFTGLKLNITDTASSASSSLMDLQVGGSSFFQFFASTLGSGKRVTKLALSANNGNTSTIVAGTNQTLELNSGIVARNIGVAVTSVGPFGWTTSPIGNGTGSVNVDDAAHDLRLYRDAANTLAQRNGTNAQEARLYGTYTNASNYRRLTYKMSTAGVAELKPEGAGTGASGNVLYISGLPTSNPGPGILWNDAGTVKVGT